MPPHLPGAPEQRKDALLSYNHALESLYSFWPLPIASCLFPVKIHTFLFSFLILFILHIFSNYIIYLLCFFTKFFIDQRKFYGMDFRSFRLSENPYFKKSTEQNEIFVPCFLIKKITKTFPIMQELFAQIQKKDPKTCPESLHTRSLWTFHRNHA